MLLHLKLLRASQVFLDAAVCFILVVDVCACPDRATVERPLGVTILQEVLQVCIRVVISSAFLAAYCRATFARMGLDLTTFDPCGFHLVDTPDRTVLL